MFSLFKQVASGPEAALSELTEEQLSDVAGGHHQYHHNWKHRHHRHHNWHRQTRHNTWRSSSSRGGWNGGYSSNSGYSGAHHW